MECGIKRVTEKETNEIGGSMLLGRYELKKEIGRGGSARVYLAWDRLEKRHWAIKEITGHRGMGSEQGKAADSAEVRFLQKLYHPALPHIVRTISQKGKLYVVMDYVEGESLEQLLQEQGPFGEEQVLSWGIQLCRVLIYLHSQRPPVIYRDLKPANIMLQQDGRLKLVDFGTARLYKERQRRDTVRLGTYGFCAPEQLSKRGQSDARTDIYSLGVTLYVLLTGHYPSEEPYEICPIRQWNPQLSKELEKIIRKCTRPNPMKRYQNVGLLLSALQHCLNQR